MEERVCEVCAGEYQLACGECGDFGPGFVDFCAVLGVQGACAAADVRRFDLGEDEKVLNV